MGVIRSLIVKLSAQTTGFNSKIRGSGKTLAKFTKTAGGVVRALTGISGALSVAGAGLAITRQFEALDKLAKNAQRIGATTQAMAGLGLAAELSGSSVDDLITSIQRMQKSLVEGNVDDTFVNIGIDPEAIRKLPTEAAFARVAEGIASIANPAERAHAAMDIFGRSGAKLMPLLNSGAEGVRAMVQEAGALGIAFDGIDAKSIEDANDAITRMKAAFGGLAGQLAIAVAPEIEAIAKKIVGIAQTLGRLQGASAGRTALDIGGSPAIQNRDDIATRMGDLSARSQALNREAQALHKRNEELHRLRGNAPGVSGIVEAAIEVKSNLGRMDQIAAAIKAAGDESDRLVRLTQVYDRLLRGIFINLDELRAVNLIEDITGAVARNPFDLGTQHTGNLFDPAGNAVAQMFATAQQSAAIEMQRRGISGESAAGRAAAQMDIEGQMIHGIEAAADRWRDAILSPMDQLKRDTTEIAAGLAGGFLDIPSAVAAFDEANGRAAAALASEPRLPAALERGSSELVSALNRSRVSPEQKELAAHLDVARRQFAEAQKANDILEEIKEEFEGSVIEFF